MVEDEESARGNPAHGTECELRNSFRIAGGPVDWAATKIAFPAGVPHETDRCVDPAAGITARKDQKCLVRARAAKGDIAFAVENEPCRKVIGTGIQLDDLPAGTRRDGAVNLLGRRSGIEAAADGRAVRNAADDPSLTPVDAPAGRDDGLLGLGKGREAQKEEEAGQKQFLLCHSSVRLREIDAPRRLRHLY